MYAAGTFELAHALQLEFLYEVPRYVLYAALTAWALTLAGLVRSLGKAALIRHRTTSRDGA